MVTLLVLLPACSLSQSLPASSPTTTRLSVGTAGPAPATTTSRRADVSFTDGLLTVSASNASLNQVLREIGRLTGMKISGGVTEDRVFGTYGPASTSQVIASLLDGTSTNILIVDKASAGPGELILTPRSGGATPPNPNAAYSEDMPAQTYGPPPQQQFGNGAQRPQSIFTGPPGIGGLPPSNGGQTNTPINGGADLGSIPSGFIPAGQSPPDATAQPGVQQSNSPAPVSADPNEPQSPNGVTTPQQIYEQLMKLRQQQQSPSPQ